MTPVNIGSLTKIKGVMTPCLKGQKETQGSGNQQQLSLRAFILGHGPFILGHGDTTYLLGSTPLQGFIKQAAWKAGGS